MGQRVLDPLIGRGLGGGLSEHPLVEGRIWTGGSGSWWIPPSPINMQRAPLTGLGFHCKPERLDKWLVAELDIRQLAKEMARPRCRFLISLAPQLLHRPPSSRDKSGWVGSLLFPTPLSPLHQKIPPPVNRSDHKSSCNMEAVC